LSDKIVLGAVIRRAACAESKGDDVKGQMAAAGRRPLRAALPFLARLRTRVRLLRALNGRSRSLRRFSKADSRLPLCLRRPSAKKLCGTASVSATDAAELTAEANPSRRARKRKLLASPLENSHCVVSV
jgi:hypothetical protein